MGFAVEFVEEAQALVYAAGEGGEDYYIVAFFFGGG